ncbi:MAG: JAB domain-containing protein [Chakrabartia sp.]
MEYAPVGAGELLCLMPDIISAFAERYVSAKQEYLLTIHLDANGHVLARAIFSSDSNDHVPFPVRSITADALDLGSKCLVLAHNHPSGIAEPSESDITQTRALAQILLPLDVEIEDHFIIAQNGLFSFRSHGLI